MRKVRTYTKEIIRQALGLLEKGDKTLSRVANSLEIPSSTLLQWKQKLDKTGMITLEGKETGLSPLNRILLF